MIDIEKFICSLLAEHPEGVAVRGDIHRALKEQGLEYKDGKIVPIEDKTELKESEDEKIKKAIKYGLDYVFTNNTTVYETTKEQCLAWLEKQGHMLDPDKVIEWLKTKVYDDSAYGMSMIDKFKKDFGL